MGNAQTWLMFLALVIGLGMLMSALLVGLLYVLYRSVTPSQDNSNPFATKPPQKSLDSPGVSGRLFGTIAAVSIIGGGMLGMMVTRLALPRGIPSLLGALLGGCAGLALGILVLKASTRSFRE